MRQQHGHRIELEPQGPWVRPVGQQQIQDRRQLRLCEVAAAIRHRAVGHFEQRLENGDMRRAGLDRAAHQPRDPDRPLEAAADVEEQPAVTTRHALAFHPAEGREVGDHPIEMDEDFVELYAPVPLT